MARTRTTLFFSFLSLVAMLFGFRPLQESTIKQVSPPKLAYDVEVTVANIDVIVRSKDGRCITGLLPENFQVYEDGILKKLTNFFEVNRLQALGFRLKEDGKMSPWPQPSSPLPEQVQNKIVFFFDNGHLHPMNRDRIAKKLETFITKNIEEGKGNQGMVVFLDRRLNILQDFTSDASSLLSAIKDIRGRTSDTLLRTLSWDDMQQEIARMASQTSGLDDAERYQHSVSYAQGNVEEQINQLNLSLQSLEALGNYFRGIKGRKILIYVSDGLPLNPAEEVFYFIGQLFPSANTQTEAMNYDASWLFKELTAKCNAEGISVYSIHGDESIVSASSADKANSSLKTGGLRSINPGTSPHNDGLEIVTRETGGSVISARGDISAGLEMIENDLSHYYSLGYNSSCLADNAYHPLDVKIVGLKDSYVIRFRKGYLKSSAEEEIKDRVIARLFLSQKDNPLDVQVHILPVEKLPFEQTKLKLTLKLLIPINKLTLSPSGNEHVGKIKVIIAMLDSKNLWSDPEELLNDIKIPNQDLEKAQNRQYPYLVEMYVKPERYFISLAITDLLSSRTSYLQFNKEVSD
jgi:VWFA-related protein